MLASSNIVRRYTVGGASRTLIWLVINRLRANLFGITGNDYRGYDWKDFINQEYLAEHFGITVPVGKEINIKNIHVKFQSY